MFLMVAFVCLAISYENSSANEKNILAVQSGATYINNDDNKAPFNIIYKFNLYSLATSPINLAPAIPMPLSIPKIPSSTCR